MDFDAINKLIDTLIAKQIDEFELEEEGRRIRIRRGVAVGSAAAPAMAAAPAPAAAPPPAAPAPASESGLVVVTSPIVGTYYESPSPDAPAFVQPGVTVEKGQVLCIIEAMKLMNEIEAELAGTVVRKLVSNGQPVEFGQPLLELRPRK